MNKPNRSNAHLKISATVFFSAITLAACTENSSEIEIPVSEVPANIVTIVQKTLPGISLVEAEKETRDEIVIYELEGTLINGKEYEIKIAADGTIIKIELED